MNLMHTVVQFYITKILHLLIALFLPSGKFGNCHPTLSSISVTPRACSSTLIHLHHTSFPLLAHLTYWNALKLMPAVAFLFQG